MTAPQGFAMIPRSVLADPTLSTDAKMVYLVLSSHVGDKATVWPSHETIAVQASMSRAQVKRKLRELRERGLVDWRARARDGISLSNEYWLIVGSAPSRSAAQQNQGVHTGPLPQGGQVEPPVKTGGPGGTPNETRGFTQTPGHTEPRGGSHGATEREPLNDLSTTSSSSTGVDGASTATTPQLTVVADPPPVVAAPPAPAPRTGPTPKQLQLAFDQFWGIYPRKQGKAPAFEKFKKAIARASYNTIMQGAVRYRDDPNREAAYTLHASTWLHQSRWDDEALPPREAPRPEPEWTAEANARQRRFAGMA
jgi:biotin operon repressor